jgi:hypothetical protein
MTQKPFAANRRVIAVEIKNLLSLRRSMRRLRSELAAGRSPVEMVRTPRGDIPRGMLLRYAEVSFGFGVAKVCAARRVLFRKAAEAAEAAALADRDSAKLQ